MEFKGSHRLNAPRELVWEYLNTPEVLQACVPGCESFSETAPDTYAAVVVAAIGPVKAKFKGNLTIGERRAPEGYQIVGQGDGGIAGFGKMVADVDLAEDGEVTVLTYTAQAQVGGKLAQIGARMIGGVANKMAEEFFKRFSAKVGERVQI
ncbi:Carbon monoxide dehydrogenase subunit G (CoxG) [Pigmentiphaga humi]|uniref:Carbon monoxide dehydrogenase subunit G (CoxG) n=1 Tax=Pigmentiphaga humi TaxID=2478468 RepID=A0A3P4B5D4_9BURK|nr:carbon monoxide dehydrogenase subunit G [Pigmentiphaga humi]VCU70375.1 Carbon monoxide dehydrogenase subunit G (CoxG) [Pigmentiphaga humi]